MKTEAIPMAFTNQITFTKPYAFKNVKFLALFRKISNERCVERLIRLCKGSLHMNAKS